MIETSKLVPEVYYKRSRDFQLLGRLCDFLFNYLKTNTNAVENNILSENFDPLLVDLMTTTLGFKKAHEYNAQQLLAFCTAFPLILRNKGNVKSLQYILNLILNVQGIDDPVEIQINSDNHSIGFFVPEELSDTALFEDVLDYILPAGMSTRIVNTALVRYSETERYNLESNVKCTNAKTVDKSVVAKLWDPSTKELPTRSDIKDERIDNSTVIPWQALVPESGE